MLPLWKVNGTSLYYEVCGQGTSLVFIHSLGLTHEMFEIQKNYFKQSYQTVFLDLRGNGQSGNLIVPVGRVIETQCEDLSFLLGYLGIKKAVIVGVSYGGIIAQKFSNLYPNQVSAIVISDSLSTNVRTTMLGKFVSMIDLISSLSYYLPGEFFLRSMKITYYKWDLAYRAIRKGMLQKRSGEWYKQRLAVRGIDFTTFLPQIKVPALCIAGDHSYSVIRQMNETAGLLSNARLQVIEDSCNPSNLCQPQRFNEIVQCFLEDNHLNKGANNYMQGY